jgi:hypothetical protein
VRALHQANARRLRLSEGNATNLPDFEILDDSVRDLDLQRYLDNMQRVRLSRLSGPKSIVGEGSVSLLGSCVHVAVSRCKVSVCMVEGTSM